MVQKIGQKWSLCMHHITKML